MRQPRRITSHHHLLVAPSVARIRRGLPQVRRSQDGLLGRDVDTGVWWRGGTASETCDPANDVDHWRLDSVRVIRTLSASSGLAMGSLVRPSSSSGGSRPWWRPGAEVRLGPWARRRRAQSLGSWRADEVWGIAGTACDRRPKGRADSPRPDVLARRPSLGNPRGQGPLNATAWWARRSNRDPS